MKYNLDRQIRLEASPKHKGLYAWCLQEIDDEGRTDRDQIPWTLSHNFVATQLTLSETASADSVFGGKGSWIRAILLPKKGERYRSPIYSMLGTDRTIDTIHLFITPINSDADRQENSVSASGFVSYTSDDPLWGGVEPDHLQFNLAVTQGEFDRIANRIAAKQVEVGMFRCHAEGFYSEWTPDIETNRFKVLADHKEQEVEVPEGVDLIPPRLGKVWDASFTTQVINVLSHSAEDDKLDGWDEEEVVGQHAPDFSGGPRTETSVMYASVQRELRGIKMLVGVLAGIALLTLIFG